MELLITFTHNSFCQKHQFLTKRHFFQHERSSVSDGLQLFSTIGKFFRVYLTTPHDLVTFSNGNKHFHCKWSIVARMNYEEKKKKYFLTDFRFERQIERTANSCYSNLRGWWTEFYICLKHNSFFYFLRLRFFSLSQDEGNRHKRSRKRNVIIARPGLQREFHLPQTHQRASRPSESSLNFKQMFISSSS